MTYVSCNKAVYVNGYSYGVNNTEFCIMKCLLLEKGLSLRSAMASVGVDFVLGCFFA